MAAMVMVHQSQTSSLDQRRWRRSTDLGAVSRSAVASARQRDAVKAGASNGVTRGSVVRKFSELRALVPGHVNERWDCRQRNGAEEGKDHAMPQKRAQER